MRMRLQDVGMIVVEVHWPGSWIGGALDRDAAHRATSLLHMLETNLFVAAIALDHFQQNRHSGWPSHSADPETRQAEWQQDNEERRRIEDALRAQLPADLLPEARWEAERALYEQARRVQQHQRWQSGVVPRQYLHNLPLMHARSFLISLDSIAQTLDQMIGEDWEADALGAVASTWEAKVPNVRAVRNTVAHESERALLRRQGGVPITLQPIDNAMVSAPGGGVLILNSLNGNRYGCTMADGHYGEVEVSVESLMATAELVQGTFDAFTWTGHERWSPSD